jgi:glucose-6-phosphate isomerase
MEPRVQSAFDAMEALESGAIANPDEKRQVGHYWLRNPSKAPDEKTRSEIVDALEQARTLAMRVHSGELKGRDGAYTDLLVIGIGGSALGPQLAADALGSERDELTLHFLDNTDPDGFDRTFKRLDARLGTTLVLVISKSGGTKETRNGMVEAQAAFEKAGIPFAKQAVAITGRGSELDRVAEQQGWIERLPMFDYVGGRTSQTSIVGLLPALLQGLDVDALLAGAADMDEATRNRATRQNPAALMALAWHQAGQGRGEKAMVILPYKDRLVLLSKYLQQLVMESLGKELDLDGNPVHQGLTVYGNKGSTDQHAYVQQLRDGPDNFFAVFIEVLKDRAAEAIEVEPGVTSGDYLAGFLHGTRLALAESNRQSMTITVPEVNARTLGMLIALFERAVGFYASLININAYHQPGVEAGKKAASRLLALQAKLLTAMEKQAGTTRTAAEWAAAVGKLREAESAWMMLSHRAANDPRLLKEDGDHPQKARFGIKASPA